VYSRVMIEDVRLDFNRAKHQAGFAQVGSAAGSFSADAVAGVARALAFEQRLAASGVSRGRRDRFDTRSRVHVAEIGDQVVRTQAVDRVRGHAGTGHSVY